MFYIFMVFLVIATIVVYSLQRDVEKTTSRDEEREESRVTSLNDKDQIRDTTLPSDEDTSPHYKEGKRSEPIEERKDHVKPRTHYLFYRVYCLSIVLVWNGVGLWEMTQRGTPHYILFLIPFAFPALFLIFNVLAFPFAYSVFGKYRRTMPPDETPLVTAGATVGRVGWLQISLPLVTWNLYSSGLGVSIFGVGKAFIPVERFYRVEKKFLRGYRLWHSCPEVRNPVYFSSKEIYRRL